MSILRIENQVSAPSSTGLVRQMSNYLVSFWNTFANNGSQSQAVKNNQARSIAMKAEQLGCNMSNFDLVS